MLAKTPSLVTSSPACHGTPKICGDTTIRGVRRPIEGCVLKMGLKIPEIRDQDQEVATPACVRSSYQATSTMMTFGSRSSNNQTLLPSSVNNTCGTSSIHSRISHRSIHSRISHSRTNIRILSDSVGITNGATHVNKPMPREMRRAVVGIRELRRGVVGIAPQTSRNAEVATSISVMLCNVNTIMAMATMLLGTINVACHQDQPTASWADNNVVLHSRRSIDPTSNT